MAHIVRWLCRLFSSLCHLVRCTLYTLYAMEMPLTSKLWRIFFKNLYTKDEVAVTFKLYWLWLCQYMISLCVIFLQKFKKLRTVFAILYKANQLCRYDLSGFDIHILNFLSVKKECQLKLPYLSRVSQHVNYHIPLQRVYQRPIAHIAKVSGSFYNEQALAK